MSQPFYPKLIVGLGNVGRKYANTYHNVGFLAVDYLAKQRLCPPFRVSRLKSFSFSRCGETTLVKPLTMVNLSGQAVAEALRFFGASADAMLVIHDDSDIALGALKIALGRGAAGHHGVESIVGALGTNHFYRLRLGVRKRPGKAAAFVLKRMSSAERATIYSALEGAIKKLTENERP